jgi:hypothetical protein
MNENNDLKSSVSDKGNNVTQYIQFSGGNEKTYSGIISSTIRQSQFTRFDCTDGKRVYINTANVDLFEVFEE